jgi:molybdate transport system ATP-binding protein
MLIVDIKKRLGDFNLNVSFTHEGGVLGLLGASGSGKSATLKCVAGISAPDSGTVILDGKILFDSKKRINVPPQKRDIGYLFQDAALFPNMTVEQNIMAGVKDPKTRKQIARKKIESMLLTGNENKYPRQLSGGQAQRVALARILAQSPKVILLDEPFSALDSYLQWMLESEVTGAIKDYAAVFVSHNRDEIYRFCDRVCVVNDGRGEEVTTTEELFNNPRTISAARLSGCKNYTRIKKIDNFLFEALDWGFKLHSAGPIGDDIVYAAVRSHYIKIVPEGIECAVLKVINELFSTVIVVRPVGAAQNLRIDIEKQAFDLDKIYVKINPERVMLLKS